MVIVYPGDIAKAAGQNIEKIPFGEEFIIPIIRTQKRQSQTGIVAEKE